MPSAPTISPAPASGSSAATIQNVSGNTTLTNTGPLQVLANAAGGAFAITLNLAANTKGTTTTVTHVGGGNNQVAVNPQGADTIVNQGFSGMAVGIALTQFMTMSLISDGVSKWYIIDITWGVATTSSGSGNPNYGIGPNLFTENDSTGNGRLITPSNLTLGNRFQGNVSIPTDFFVAGLGNTLGAIQAKSANYPMVVGDYGVYATGGAGGITITLKNNGIGTVQFVKKVDAGAGAVTVAADVGTIDGTATKALAAQFNSFLCGFDGTNWQIISKN